MWCVGTHTERRETDDGEIRKKKWIGGHRGDEDGGKGSKKRGAKKNNKWWNKKNKILDEYSPVSRFLFLFCSCCLSCCFIWKSLAFFSYFAVWSPELFLVPYVTIAEDVLLDAWWLYEFAILFEILLLLLEFSQPNNGWHKS